MASLLPLIHDILPMVLPASIAVTKAADVLPPPTDPGEQNGERPRVQVISRNAVVEKSDKMCASGEHPQNPLSLAANKFLMAILVLIVKPNSSSPVRHHGEQGTLRARPYLLLSG